VGLEKKRGKSRRGWEGSKRTIARFEVVVDMVREKGMKGVRAVFNKLNRPNCRFQALDNSAVI